ncbi:MAG: hypothetical protein AAB969_04005 [Patescibacteria group bacterium]
MTEIINLFRRQRISEALIVEYYICKGVVVYQKNSLASAKSKNNIG